ncbi:hypothetical protein BDW71DRAFT_204683 [Aspergillus fruticulosus]
MLAQWAARCLPGYSTLALLVLLLLSASDAIPGPWRDPAGNKPDRPTLNLAQKIFIVYSFFVRLNTLLFTGRLSWALFYSFTQTSKVPKRRAAYLPSGTPEPSSPRGDPPPTALDKKFTQDSISKVAEEVTRAIIIPKYNEDVGTLRETLDVLASHPRA